jgi:FkbM family methyltransferase
VDLVGALLWRVVRPIDHGLMARLLWARERRAGALALRLVDGLVGRGDVALDIGANFGQFTYGLSRLVGDEGEVHAFEPHPAQSDNLARAERARANVTFHAVALSDRPDTAELAVPRVGGEPDLALATLEQRSGNGREVDRVTVRVETLDGLLAGRTRPVDFVKCDVEGHERAVLAGAAELIETDAPTMLIEIEQRHQHDDIRDTFRLVEELGYDGYAVRSDALAPLSEFDIERDQLAFVRAEPEAALLPPGYVNDFLFVSRRRSVSLPVPLTPAAA